MNTLFSTSLCCGCWCLVLLLATLGDGKLIEYASQRQTTRLALAHANPTDFIRSTWVIRVVDAPMTGEMVTTSALTGERHDWDDPQTLDQLNRTLQRDRCSLMRVALNDATLTFKVYCDVVTETLNREGQTPEDAALIVSVVLNHTLNDYLYRIFPRHTILAENNQLMRHVRPHFFYGSEELVRYAIRRDQMRWRREPDQGNRKKTADEELYELKYPDPRTYDHIRQNNFFQTAGVGWALARIDTHTGVMDYQYEYIDTASDVDVYVIDTGIRTDHTEFGGRATWLINTVGDGIQTDGAGHGTFVASEIGGATYGVAKSVQLFAVKVLDSQGDGDLYTIQAGIQQVLQTAAARAPRRAVINLSLGGSRSAMLDSAVATLTANGLVTVVSAGNTGEDACQFSPAALGGQPSTNVITVAASDINDNKPSWSNYGACVTLTAPGVNVTGAGITSNTAVRSMSGTSMSSPLAAGVAAIILDQDASLSVAQVKNTLVSWSTPNIVQYASAQGGGRKLLYSLIDVTNTPPTPPPTPSPPFVPQIPGLPSGAATTSSVTPLFTACLLGLLLCIM